MLDRRRLAGGMAGLAAAACSTGAMAMSVYAWRKRPLVIFAADAQSPALATQRAIVESARAGFIERDMVVVYVIGDAVTSDLGSGPGIGAAAMRSLYGVPATAFRALLVGKDGGVKLSSSAPLTAKALFTEIDGMPMRREEMRRRSG